VEILENEVLVLSAPDRPPLKPDVSPVRYAVSAFEEILRRENVTRESVYCIVPPSWYFKNTLVFPFNERQKIESTIKFEIVDSLPISEGDFLTDFLVFDAASSSPVAADREKVGPAGRERPGSGESQVYSFSIPKEAVKGLLEGYGVFRENLKGVIPYDAAFFAGATSVIDAPSFLCIDIRNDDAGILFVKGRRIERSVFLRRFDEQQYRSSLVSSLLVLEKSASSPPLYVNTRTTASEEFRRLNEEILGELDIVYRAFPARGLAGGIAQGAGEGAAVDMVAIAGGLLLLNQPASKKVNLLKEEFKARPKGYLRLKDFATLGALLLILLVISLSNLFMELSSVKSQNRELKAALSELGVNVFQKQEIRTKDAQGSLELLRKKIEAVEASIDRRGSSIELLRELSSFLPGDVVLEFTDIIIEKKHIKFGGKARTFADIDRIKEALSASEYFRSVSVTNTGTTGSGEGFTVTFLFDIDVAAPASGKPGGSPNENSAEVGEGTQRPGAAVPESGSPENRGGK